jgi:3-phenylpropionate/cinnamic acid dioxygenase small subunit
MRRRRDLYAPDETPCHVLSNVFILDFDDGTAQVKTFFTFILIKVGEPLNVRSLGYYDDVFRNDGDKWRIYSRTVRGVGR